jgi:folate-dependent phosphoribosylglycinamide formyltransferase PurN
MRPIRVVLFCGAVPDPGALQLLAALQAQPEIELVGAFAESPGFSLRQRVADLWRRRRWLLLPLLGAEAFEVAVRAANNPLAYWRNRQRLAELAGYLEVVADLHAPEALEQLRGLQPDLGLIYGGPILRPALFTLPPLGTLGIHHGKVPQYRGKKTTFWAMYNGEPSVGVTIQRLNAGLDTGEIVADGEVPVAGRSYRQVWSDLERLGVELFLRAVLDVASGEAVFRPQSGPRGRLYRDPSLRDLVRFSLRRYRPPSPAVEGA